MSPTPRQAGLLLHPTSLPGGHGVGDLGGEATRLLDWMAGADLTLWQVLPTCPVGLDGSPYSAWSALGGNPLLVDLHALVAAHLLDVSDLHGAPHAERVDYPAALAFKLPRVRKAASRLCNNDQHPWRADLSAFERDNAWAAESALFAAERAHQDGAPWWAWPTAIRDRQPRALAAARRRHADAIAHGIALEFLFDRQWQDLHVRAAARGIELFGDIPIYVGGDSVDTWSARTRFSLGANRLPTEVAGVPPDAFSDVGQRWGNPLYDWEAHGREDYAWWAARLTRALALCDLVRIDHFRAFAAYWSIPADAADARAGHWRPGPGRALFDALRRRLGDLPLVAEDLGTIDAEVHGLMDSAGLPGMEVLQFAFDGDPHNAYLPHNHRRQAVAYVGTHDNDTALGWWQSSDDATRHRVRTYFGVDGNDIVWDLIRATLASPADRAVVTAQDVLALGAEGRMNTPGSPTGNWGWRLHAGALQSWHADRLRTLIGVYGRAGGGAR